jgi:hypothetical protein
MPIARFQMPDGRVARFEVPEGTTPEQAQSLMAAQMAGQAQDSPEKPQESSLKKAAQGFALGVSDIGNTVLNAAAYLPGKVSPAIAQWSRTRNADFDAITEQNKDSMAFGAGRLGGNVAATLPVGGALAGGARAVGAAPALVSSLATGGMRAGGMTGAAGMAVRTLGGAVTGGASAGLIDPENAGLGAVFGGALPGAVKVGGKIGGAIADGVDSGAKRLMQSAIKPTIAQLKSGDAALAVEMMLKYGINPTKAGVGKLRGLVDDLNDQIGTSIANSGAKVDKSKVVDRLADVRAKFGNQVSPTADLGAIRSAGDDFMAHPNFPNAQIPVADAQALKQGTYRVLAKKYGQMGSADVEAQKALARGLKDEIAEAVPGISALNAEESKLIATLGVAERRALMEMNKNPMGLAALAQSPASWAMFMADKSALFKSVTARMLNSSTQGARKAAPQLENALARPMLRNGLTLPRSDE